MRAMWRGSISFGLINVPIKMYAATEKKSISFRQIHRECGTPIHYEKYVQYCGRKVEDDEIARGYEFEKGRYVIIEDKDLESIPDETTRTIDIIDFVDLVDIDPIYYSHSYFWALRNRTKSIYSAQKSYGRGRQDCYCKGCNTK